MSATISPLRATAAGRAAVAAVEPCATVRVLGSALSLRPVRDASPGIAAGSADSLERAIALYERRQWGAAFAILSRLADRHDPAAAKLALLMLRYGESLYGTRFSALPQQIARWARQVIDAAPAAASAPPKAADVYHRAA